MLPDDADEELCAQAEGHHQTKPALHWRAMSLVVHLPEELARRVEAVAAERHVSPEQVALQAIEAQLSVRRRLGFIGLGHSGRTDLSEHVSELRHELAEEKLAEHRRSAGG